MSVQAIINGVIDREGGYVNDKRDSGGETMYGITVAVARAAGYTGAMKDMPLHVAESIYFRQYVTGPNFDDIIPLSEAIASELVDTGVNMGPGIAGQFLQTALNAFNEGGKRYPDLKVDGQVGLGTIAALRAFLQHRGKAGETVMLKALNCLQGARYLSITEARPANEAFVYGWIRERIGLGD